jgi:hypothetical protein
MHESNLRFRISGFKVQESFDLKFPWKRLSHHRWVMFLAQGRLDEAEQMYKRALDTFTRSLDPSHPHISTCVENYAELLRDRGREAEAEALEAQYRKLSS